MRYPVSPIVMCVASLALAAASSEALANHSWGGYHWARTSNPFTVRLGDNVSSAWDQYLNTASSDWSGSAVLDTVVAPGQATNKQCRPTSGKVQVCNATYGNNGWLGVAQIWISGLHITQGSVKLNDTYFNTATYNSPAWRHLVTCQEVGHTFGLDHQDTNFSNTNLGTCMDYTNNPLGPPSNEQPNKHDYDELVTIYSHLDSFTTLYGAGALAPMLPGISDVPLDTPREWGRLVRSTHNGRTEVYERDLGFGYKAFTFVIWADDDPHHRVQ